mmetsp:Transcript_34287/g.58198  ORF Transcript_34287/g.58198 Transcript_34287/m.58198 type:complete len:88 (-) Transcript_34287:36-299(-)
MSVPGVNYGILEEGIAGRFTFEMASDVDLVFWIADVAFEGHAVHPDLIHDEGRYVGSGDALECCRAIASILEGLSSRTFLARLPAAL